MIEISNNGYVDCYRYASRNKQEQRRYARCARNAIGSGLAARKSLAAISRILAHEAYRKANNILFYCAHHRELDLSELIETALAEGKNISFPVMDGQGSIVAAMPKIRNGRMIMETGRYGAQEPCLSGAKIVNPVELNLVLVPGIAFDRDGIRLGWGVGHYDRFLPLCKNAFFMAIAYEEQMMDKLICDPWDAKMHAIITDSNVYTINE